MHRLLEALIFLDPCSGRCLNKVVDDERRQAFEEWCALHLDAKATELQDFIRHAAEPLSWVRVNAYSALIPRDCAMPIRVLSLCEIEACLIYGTDAPDWRVRWLLENGMQEQQAPTLPEAARQLRTSSRRLRWLFRQQTGVSYGRFLRLCRVAIAATHLKESAASIREVSRRLGYSDPSNFVRQFRKMIGVTPHDYRRAAHAQIRQE
jgi:AraC-like DNA-binding protein